MEELEDWWKACLPLYFRRPEDADSAGFLGRTRLQLDVVNQMAQEIAKYDVVAELGNIGVPTLVLSGRHDWVTPASEGEILASGVPGATLEVFEESGHFTLVEEQERFLSVVARFVSSAHEQSGASFREPDQPHSRRSACRDLGSGWGTRD